MFAERRWSRRGLAASMAWLALVFVVDVLNDRPTFALTVLYAIAALIACAVLPPRPTGVVAVSAIVLALASGTWNHTWGTTQHAVRVVDVVLVGCAAVTVAAIRVRREQQIVRLSALADVAQRAILPVLPLHAGPVAVAARYLSAAEGALVGGDLYDCYHYVNRATGRTERVRFIVGDVRGKGIAGVEQAARVIRAFRQSAAVEPSLPEVAEAMDQYLADFFGDEEFVTAILVDASDDVEVRAVSCGHPAPLLQKKGGLLALVDCPAGLPLGLGLAHAVPYQEVALRWADGDRLLMYTDGLSEARDQQGQFLSPTSLGAAMAAPDLSGVMDGVMSAVERHIPHGRLTDDLALLVLENAGATRRRESTRTARPEWATKS